MGKCDCKLKCILCKSVGHNAHSPDCPKHKGTTVVLPAPLCPAGWKRADLTKPGMGVTNHPSTEPLPKPAKPKAGSNTLAKDDPLTSGTKAQNSLKAAMEGAGKTFSKEKFSATFSKPAPTETTTPLIPFTRISEDAFFEMYKGHNETLPVPNTI